MAILNLKTFINNTVKKGDLYYYEHENYYIFTNGEIAYGIKKGSMVERPDQYLNELLELSTIEFESSNALDEIVEIYHKGKRKQVTKYKDSFINNSKTVNVFTDMQNSLDYTIIDKRYKDCCKSIKKCFKESFIIETTIKNKEMSLYFESPLNDDEFVLIMPITVRKG